MATPKKPTIKKTAAKKPATKASSTKTAAKKPVTKAAAAKKPSGQARHHRVFALSIVPDDKPFFTLRLTTQTLYWLIFAVTILGLGLWILKLNMDIISLYNQIDQNNIAASESYPNVKHPATTKK